MKKIFSMMLVCCTAFAFANDEPVFEETDENAGVGVYAPFFAAETPVFEDDPESCKECGCEDEEENTADAEDATSPENQNAFFPQALCRKPGFASAQNYRQHNASYINWRRYKANFGMEKLFVRFPQKPSISQTNTLLTAFAYDRSVLYSVTGYYPPIGGINPMVWFEEVLYTIDQAPFRLISHVIFQVSSGDWVMDYTAHDYVQNLAIKARAIVTPFNAYTLQCVKPNGARDCFDYFLDSFWIRCECTN